MAAAEVLGVTLPSYKSSDDAKKKREVLHDWQAAHERYLLKPMNCPHHCMMFCRPAAVLSPVAAAVV